jgi:uncharacterized protein
MKFYDRYEEITQLHEIMQSSKIRAQMTVVMGRRRIGKTKLLLHAFEGIPTAYLFVARKSEPLLCADFVDEIKEELGLPVYGEMNDFKSIFKLLIDMSKQNPFNLIIDEFQEFRNVNDSIYSDMQNIWDRNRDVSKMNLILCGSIYSMMHKIFENEHEPLFNRADHVIRLQPFTTQVLKNILADNHPQYTKEDLLALYTFTGGVAKYVELFIDNKAFTFNKMVSLMVQPNSAFLQEGKNDLVDEFGKDYATYFSILSCISTGFTARTAIESYLKREVGGFLTRLEQDFGLIEKHHPMFAKSGSKNIHYQIKDNFLRFWFRFFYKYVRFIEAGALGKLQEVIMRDYPTFSGLALENYFRSQYKESGNWTDIGGYWDRKGENEVDLIALDELSHTAVIAEIKRKRSNIDLNKLREKTYTFKRELTGYNTECIGLSMEDM